MAKFTSLTCRMAPLPANNIDTDQIIPARYLKATDKTSLANHLFADWRYDTSDAPRPDFVLNQPQYQGAQVLLAGDHFGCGSSREHAPIAIKAAGVSVVIAKSFARIFYRNAINTGLPIMESSARMMSFPSSEGTLAHGVTSAARPRTKWTPSWRSLS